MIHPEAGVRSFGIEWTLEKRWFLQFFVSILICINNGACFCFGIFSPYMKQGAFKYNQSQVNLVSTVGVILSYFSLPTGFLYDYKGPKLTLMIGTILNLVGWLGMFIIFINMDNPLLGTNVVVMCIFYGISQFSASFYETGSVLTNLDAFSCYQGRVILIQKTFMGLGSSVIVQIYLAFFEIRFTGIGEFFLFLVFYSLSVGILGTIFVRLPTEKTNCLGLNIPDESVIQTGGGESPLFRIPFNIGTAILLLSIAFILAVTLIENFHPISETDRIIIGTCTVILCISFSIMIFITPSYSRNIGGYFKESTTTNLIDDVTVNSKAAALQKSELPSKNEGKTNTNKFFLKSYRETNLQKESPRIEKKEEEEGDNVADFSVAREFNTKDLAEPYVREERCMSKGWSSNSGDNFNASSEAIQQEIKLNSKSLLYNMKRREMWLMWYVCLASWSSATVVSTNSSQIYEAMDFNGYSSTVNVVFVSIYGVASAMGRVAVGAAHPILIRKKIPVSLLFCIAPVLNFIGLPLFLGMPKSALVVPFFIVGLATGVSWGSTILIIKGLFAPDNCGKHYSALYTAGIISPLIFNIALFGPVYDYYSKQQGLYDTRQCEGRLCIWVPLTICAIVNLIAFPMSIYLLFRIRKRGGLL